METAIMEAPKAVMTVEEMKGKLSSVSEAYEFMTAGKAIVTLRSKKSGARFTFKIKNSDNKSCRFVSVLTGQDNSNSYEYLGHILVRSNVFFPGKNSRINRDAPSMKAFEWAWRFISSNQMPKDVEIWHEGCCGRCGRRLTVPESIASGFGPECAGRMANANGN